MAPLMMLNTARRARPRGIFQRFLEPDNGRNHSQTGTFIISEQLMHFPGWGSSWHSRIKSANGWSQRIGGGHGYGHVYWQGL